VAVTGTHTFGASTVILLSLAGPLAAFAQSDQPSVDLTVTPGALLQIVVDQRVKITGVGQPIRGTVADSVYAFDRLVIPAGTLVLGHVAALEGPSKLARTRAILAGDLTPRRQVVLNFDTLVLNEEQVPIHAIVTAEIPHLTRTAAPTSPEETPQTSVVGRAKHSAEAHVHQTIAAFKQTERDVLAEITQPGRRDRLKNELIQRLPYHPQFIDAGTGYQTELTQPLGFGQAIPGELAPAAVRPAPSSILRARLVTTLDSATTPRGTAIRARVTEPVFTAAHQLIYPEGTILTGEVTLAKPARWLHRNGQLRFLFENVEPPAGGQVSLPASLYAVHASADDRVSIDEEGGATVTDSKARFIAPTLALLALRGSLDEHEHLDPDGDGHVIHSGSPGAQSVGGFIGLGMLGVPLGVISRPLGIALSAIGAARTIYRNVIGKGREVQFQANTLIQLQLAPGPSAGP